MTVRLTTRCLTIGASIALFCYLGVAQETVRSGTVSVNSIVEALEKAQTGVRPQVSYQVIREYRLFGASDSSANSDVVAEVDFNPPASKDYRIEKSSGSARGWQVVRRVLDHEVEATSDVNRARSAINRDNRFRGGELGSLSNTAALPKACRTSPRWCYLQPSVAV